MPVWDCSCNFAATFIGPDPTDINAGPNYAGAGYALACINNPGAGSNHLLVIGMAIVNNRALAVLPAASGVYESRAMFSVFVGTPAAVDPYQTGSVYLGTQGADITVSDGGVGFSGGGTLSIVKNTVSGAVTFTSPLGTYSTTAAALGIAAAAELRPIAVGIALNLDRIFPPVPHTEVSVDMKSFSGKEDGTQITGAALSSVDPGSWDPWTESLSVGAGTNMALATFTQMVLLERADLDWAGVPTATPSNSYDAYYRHWTGPDITPTGFSLDLTDMPEHAAVWGAWTPASGNQSITVRRSHNFGAAWTDFAAVSGADPLGALSIQAWAGIVFVVYYDATLGQTMRTQSRDAGLTWSTPVSVSISGTNPRLVVSPDGTFFYFSISGGNIVLQRSFDFGATLFDASPITVATGVSMQDFGAVIAADRSLLVAYAASLVWVTRRSRDFGLTWSTV